MSNQTIPPILGDLLEHFPLIRAYGSYGGQWHLSVQQEIIPALSEHLVRSLGGTLATIVGTDERVYGRDFRLYHVFNLPLEGLYLTLVSDVDAEFPSIARSLPAASWAEREVHDLLGLTPVGHPDLRPLVLAEDWPAGQYPLRRDFDPAELRPRQPAEMQLAHVRGEGVFEVAVGPVHAGIIEPGHFRFSVDGEHIIQLEARLFWKHRGFEKRAEGGTLLEGLMLAERVCGACSFANSLAYCQAIEALAGCQVPERARYLRVIAAELERLYNHAGDIAGVLTDIAYSVGAAHGMRLREQLLQLNEVLAGNRLLMGLNTLGGVRRDLSPAVRQHLMGTLPEILREFKRWRDIISSDESVLERLETTGILTEQVARDLGVVGPAGRASGIDRDVRRDHPYAAYDRLEFKVPMGKKGDVLARVRVKSAEIEQSVDLILQALRLMPEGAIAAPLGDIPGGQWALGATESARGENLHWVMLDRHGRIDRYKVRTSSYMTWPALPLAALGNIVPDFPVVNKSFNLCYACTDR